MPEYVGTEIFEWRAESDREWPVVELTMADVFELDEKQAEKYRLDGYGLLILGIEVGYSGTPTKYKRLKQENDYERSCVITTHDPGSTAARWSRRDVDDTGFWSGGQSRLHIRPTDAALAVMEDEWV